MHKRIVLAIVAVVIICLLCFKLKKSHDNEYVEYCYQIYQEVKDTEFKYAKFDDKNLIFYDTDRNEISKMEYTNYKPSFKIIYIENNDDTIAFWSSGSLDDGSGILFVKDEQINGALDGIKTLKRNGGASYWFSTYGSY